MRLTASSGRTNEKHMCQATENITIAYLSTFGRCVFFALSLSPSFFIDKRCQTCNCNQKCWYYANTHASQSQCVWVFCAVWVISFHKNSLRLLSPGDKLFERFELFFLCLRVYFCFQLIRFLRSFAPQFTESHWWMLYFKFNAIIVCVYFVCLLLKMPNSESGMITHTFVRLFIQWE